MRRVVLLMLLVVCVFGSVIAQEPTGNMTKSSKGLTEEAAKRVRGQLMALEEEKVNCFSNVGQDAGWSATWIKWHDADGIIHVSDRLRSKAELMDEECA